VSAVARRNPKIMKKLNVIALMPWYPANGPRWMADAFEQMGHRVFRVGPTYFDHMGLKWPKKELPKVNIPFPKTIKWVLNDIVNCATEEGFAPDLLFLSEENYQNEIVPTDKVPVVLWSADGWAQNFARREMIKPTLAYCNHPRGVVPSRQDTIPDGWKFLPTGAAPWIHKYDPDLERFFDFTLFCTMYGQRPHICQGLKELGFHVLSGQATTADFIMGYNYGRFTYHNAQTQWEAKFRLFEAAAMGCVNIADSNPLFSVLGFIPFQHYIPIEEFEPEFDSDLWPSAAAIGRAIRRCENYPDISQKARWLVENNHTYQHRCRQILFDLGLSDDRNYTDYDEILRLTYGR
jgi:hypothetical protein